jgi:hypothetical protein
MNEMKPISNFKNKLYQVAIILLLAYAAFSTAMRDLDRLQAIAGNVQTATADGLGGLAKVYSATRSLAEGTELARAPQASSTNGARVDFLAAGGSISLAGFDDAEAEAADNLLVARVHNKDACTLRKRQPPKATSRDFTWNLVAEVPKQIDSKGIELLSGDILVDHDAEVARVIPRNPRLRAVINKLPLKPGKERWSNIGEFKSLNDVIGFGFKAARTEEADNERRVERVEASDDGSRYRFEFKRGASDSDGDSSRDELEMHQ